MTNDEIQALVQRLDAVKGSEQDEPWAALRPLGEAVVPHLLVAFPSFRSWLGRTALVYHAIRHARASEAAFQLGIAACRDRSYMVRYRACGLLAYSLREDALLHLQPLLTHQDERTVEDANAAIDAIRARNHHYFVDRDHSGRSLWQVE